MFQTELNIFLQSFSNDVLNTFFKLITGLGYESFIQPFLIVFMFGISYKRGYTLVQIVILNWIATDFFKKLLALPRPAHVDSSVRLLGENCPNPTPYKGMGARSFFGAIPEEAVDFARTSWPGDFGFPSGHTSSAVALWGSISTFFEKKWLQALCASLILLVPLSRVYLGLHFLADILGGYLIGFVAFFLFYKLITKNQSVEDFVFSYRQRITLDAKTALFAAYSLLPPLLLLFIPHVDPEQSALLLGVNLGFGAVRLKGIPDDQVPVHRRVIRVIVASLSILIISVISEHISESVLVIRSAFANYIRQTLIMALMIWVPTELNVRLGLFKRE